MLFFFAVPFLIFFAIVRGLIRATLGKRAADLFTVTLPLIAVAYLLIRPQLGDIQGSEAAWEKAHPTAVIVLVGLLCLAIAIPIVLAALKLVRVVRRFHLPTWIRPDRPQPAPDHHTHIHQVVENAYGHWCATCRDRLVADIVIRDLPWPNPSHPRSDCPTCLQRFGPQARAAYPYV